MLKRALAANASTDSTGTQQSRPGNQATQKTFFSTRSHQPLASNPSLINVQRPLNPRKRPFAAMHTACASASVSDKLHANVFFNEDDFDDDDQIELDFEVPPAKVIKHSPEVKYPTLPRPDLVTYPTLPHVTPSQDVPHSTPVPWSTSPAEHWDKPQIPSSPPVTREGEEQKPKPRRKIPWDKKELPSDAAPLEVGKNAAGPWDRSLSELKAGQKFLKGGNVSKVSVPKVTHEKQANLPATHLSEEQLKVVKVVVDEGKSVFFTGSAGTGKSVLMRSIIARLRQKFQRDPDRLAITASTGLAACVIEGSTLHSWAGIGLGKEPVPELCKRIKRNAKTKTKWLRTKVLIIDEVSMVDGELFDKLEQIARTIRNNGKPFGGIQIVVTGDFFQLPPVPEKNQTAKFAFEAGTWDTCVELTILLTHVFRQKDPAFANMLNEMRLGKLSSASIASFQKLSRPLDFHDELEATELFPTRHEVDNANNTRMKRLAGTEQVYKAIDGGVNDLVVRNKILTNFIAPESLTLKKGAQVMLIKNLDSQLVNGTIGKVIAFMDAGCYAAYKGDEDTYHLAHEPPDGVDDEAKAAARVKFNVARYKYGDNSAPQPWPMVRFPLQDGTYRDVLCLPEEWKTENQQQEVTAKRSQVPLILAWALSIHKAQGQTLQRVKVDLGKVFEKGQAYVALSRATSQAGLQVLRFDARKVMVHPKVIHFYQKLQSIHSIWQNKKEQTSFDTRKGTLLRPLENGDTNAWDTAHEDDAEVAAYM